MKSVGAELAQQEVTQISATDPDARSMQETCKTTGTVGYNVQCAVEVEPHLIVAHEVTNAVNDRSQFLSMARKAKAALGAETMEAFADRGYYKAEEVLACEGAGILPCVARPRLPIIRTAGSSAGSTLSTTPRPTATLAQQAHL